MDSWLKTNYTQTTLTEKKWKGLPDETKAEFIDIVEKIEWVANLTSSERRRAKDLPKDSEGRIVVDLENPHILEDMSYFTEARQHFEKYGKYTNHFPNPHPGSEYYKFWKQETHYCLHGKVRESDGEWIPGYYYWYLNYSPILISVDSEKGQENNSKHFRSERKLRFPKIWDSDYLYFHYVEKGESRGEFGVCLKTRGRGYSFKASSMATRNQSHIKKSKTYFMASEKEYLDKDGLFNKYMDHHNFIAKHTPLPSAKIKEDRNKMHYTVGYKDSKTGLDMGLMSEVLGVTLLNNPNKARGKRGKLILYEEAGKFPGLLTAWSIARMSLEDGRSVFGYMMAFGTGGTVGADFEALEKMFYNPKGYRIYAMRNVFDKVKGSGKCGFFVPEYMNRNHCYDENGNSDVIKALLEILEDRRIIKYGTTDPNALTQEKADRPITPQEAVMRVEGSMFPVDKLKDYLAEISPNINAFLEEHIECDVYITEEGATINTNISRTPIRDFPIKENKDRIGAVEIFELPKKDSYGEIPFDRYIAGIDTYDDDEGASLGSIMIMDLWTDRIVAEYSGRKKTAFEFYETCAGLLMLYNAKANYEANKKGLYAWFYNNNLLHYLCETPEILRDMNYIKHIGEGNKGVGTNTNQEINKWGRRLQADWMLQMAYESIGDDQKEELTEDGEPVPPKMKSKLRTLRSIAYIKECISWNPDGNFDRVSAGNMLFILREQRLKYVSQRSEKDRGTILSEDDYFTRNYKEKSRLDYFTEINRTLKNYS